MPTDAHNALMALVGDVYDAAMGHQKWIDIGAQLRRQFSADLAVLVKPLSSNGPLNLLAETDATLYAAYFHKVDPFRARIDGTFGRNFGRVQHGHELVPDRELLNSEYYVDYGRHNGQRHLMGGMIGAGCGTPVALHRGDSAYPFDDEDNRRLSFLLPHLQRALELRKRLKADQASLDMTFGALNNLAASIVVVDAGARVLFANAASERILKRRGSGVTTMASGPSIGAAAHLTAHHREDARALVRLVAATANGGPGGSLRVRPRDDDRDVPPMQVVLVSQVPPGLVAQDDPIVSPYGKLVLVVIDDLSQRVTPPAALLCDLFGFSRAEADVALTLVGGAIAEDVAATRSVSLDTVRGQIRAILRKSEAANLRDLERRIATLAALAGVRSTIG